MPLGNVLLILVVYALAVARVTRLINGDTILDRPRLWIEGRRRQAETIMDKQIELGHDPDNVAFWARREARWRTAFYFVQCPWCVGMWLAFGTAWVPIYLHENPVARYVSVALAVSHLVGVCARFADTEDMSIEDDTATR